MSINAVQIEGNLTRSPEAKAVGDKTVIKFGIAHNERKKDASGQWIDGDPAFYEVEFWAGDPSYWLKRLDKGVGVVVFGSLKFDTWEKDGVKHSMVKIRAETIAAKWLPEVKQAEDGPPSTGDTGHVPQPGDPDYIPF